MRTAIYARYSSDLQSAASVEDQVRLCEEHARREGWEVVRRYADHGLSGASLVRPGIQQLLQDAAAGAYDLLLSGLVKCGVCGSGFVKISQQHFGCAGARNKGTCPNARTIRRDVLEASVLNGLQNHLMDPALLEVFCEEYTRHLNALRMAASGQRVQDEARLQKITRELDRLVDALVEGVPAERVKGRMLTLEAEKATLEARLAAMPAEERPLLHPRMAQVYRKAVANLRETLETGADRAEAVNLLRSLIDRIVLNPAEDEASGFLIDLEGDLAGILSLCAGSKKAARVSADGLEQIKLVAGAGFEPATFRL